MSALPGRSDPALEALARHVAQDALEEARRAAHRAQRLADEALEDARARAEGLEAAARRLGAARGSAVAAAARRAGAVEAAEVRAQAFAALLERFLTRVRLRLLSLPGTPRHARALAAWAREAAARAAGPVEVHVEAGLRPQVYDALLAAGLSDLRVHADPRVRVGFVVRDVDGRTLLDRRPEALIAERRAELEALLATELEPALKTAPEALPPAVEPGS